MTDEPQLEGVDVWSCMTIYVPAADHDAAVQLVSERYAGTRTMTGAINLLDGEDIPLEDEDFISSAVTLYGPADDVELVLSSELKKLREDRAAVLDKLKELLPGTEATGRWLNQNGDECDEGDDGAEWQEYDAGEQAAWLETVAAGMRELVEKLES